MSIAIHEKLLAKFKYRFPMVHEMLSANGVLCLREKKDVDFFAHMARTVAGQQLSKQAATTIWKRVLSEAERNGIGIFEFCGELHKDEIRKCGLSRSKVSAILSLKAAIENNEIVSKSLRQAPLDEIRKQVTKLWGFGDWSADMIAISFFGHPDVWAPGDAALQRGVKILSGGDAALEVEILRMVRPYRTYLALHVWRALDSKII